MESLFNEDGRLSGAGVRLDNELCSYFENLFKRYTQYSAREISNVAMHALTLEECTTRLVAGIQKRKEKA